MFRLFAGANSGNALNVYPFGRRVEYR